MTDKMLNAFDIWITAQGVKSRTRSKSVDNISLEGIAGLRELILELAIQGKLVSQDINEEPASVLLNRIEAERNSLLKQGKIKSKVELESNSGSLPRGWAWAQLPLICDINVGRTPSTKDSQYWSDSTTGIPWVSISDMNHSGIINKTEKYISKIAADKIFKGLPATAGTLLMSFKLTVGKISILDIDAYHNEAIISIRPFADMNRDYLFKVLPKIALRGNTKKAIMGNTLNSSSLASLQIPIPPLAEQHRIVAKVDELMDLCDALEQQEIHHLKSHQLLVETLLGTLTRAVEAKEFQQTWNKLYEHFDDLFTTEDSIDQLKQTILQLAVMGKLVPQNPSDEPSSELLKRIAKEKERLLEEGKIKKQKTLLEAGGNESLIELRDGWAWCKLGEIITLMDSGWSPACLESPAAINKWGVLKTTSVQIMEYLENENKELPEKLKAREQYEVKGGDILITRAGPRNRVGICCLVKSTRNRLMISDKIIRFHLLDRFTNPEFITLLLNSGVSHEFIESKKSGMADSQLNISQENLKKTPLPIPPLNEQNRIVTKVEELFAFCDRLKGSIAEAQKVANQMAETVAEQV